MVDNHGLPAGCMPENAVRNNGPDALALERFKLRELAEGWATDACEWDNLKSIFHPNAYVYTTWTGRVTYLDFIKASQDGMDQGVFIMHRVHGCTTDINPEATRAVTKMKATITQRFNVDGCEFDVECDCRFCYFWEKDAETQQWGARFVRHWYEKDKLLPVNPRHMPILNDKKLATYPQSYRFLAYFQEATMGVNVIRDMPGHRRDGQNVNGQKHDMLYWQCKEWVEGNGVTI
ncbi:pep2-like protein [[Emmonsia] crescens]|uniref:Pep2-like protein n=1 Tax=[Emmonsia] crescens TaxID=73230 RepID=A0A0G2I539_9EURO|nr:pep2-like protein [Emmonsia crescens UAMH 3008]